MMSAEVGILDRNIKIMGDEASKEQEFGCHVLVSGSFSVGKVNAVEFNTTGQMGQLGR